MGYLSEMTGISVQKALEKVRTALNITNDNTDSNLELATTTDIANQEDKNNKVTTISSASTNTQYPSAKAVYNHVNNAISAAITDIDTLIGSGVIV